MRRIMKVYLTIPLILTVCFLGSLGLAQVSVQDNISSSYSPWSTSVFSLISTDLADQKKGSAQIFSYNYLALNYRLYGGRKVSAGLPFLYSSAGYNSFGDYEKSQLSLHDIFVRYTIYNLALLPANIGVWWEGRLFFPTSKSARRQGTIARFRNSIILNKPISQKLTLEYFNKLTYYVQSQPIYEREFTNSKQRIQTVFSNTKKIEMDHSLNLWYLLDDQSRLGLLAGGKNSLYNSSLARKTSIKKKIFYGLQYKHSFNSHMNLILQYRNSAYGQQSFGGLTSKGSDLSLLSFIRF